MRTLLFLIACLVLAPAPAGAEDGYRLWLRYAPLPSELQNANRPQARSIVVEGRSAVLESAAAELQRGLSAMLVAPVGRGSQASDGSIVLRSVAPGRSGDGFRIGAARRNGHQVLLVEGAGDTGTLYGAFALLRQVQLGRPLRTLSMREEPRYRLRMLDHWDNLDGFVERGYAGASLWDWASLPGRVDPRLTDYARANASVGINAAVLTNVNADARVLTPPYLAKVAAIAAALRPWGMRTFLTARFSAPMEIGGLHTADPADPAVRRWWKRKADEIYRNVPDFGGFLVKANSEGQPGPGDYGRSHGEGANMLADALAPHGGTLLWRAFVYSLAAGSDRARQAYDEFHPLDGLFRSNVVLQVKNGPVDFQPREPFHPLFGQMPRTRLAMEVQLTKEYLGFSTHLAFLAPMWSEALQAHTERPDAGPRVLDSLDVLAGVANAGQDRNWTGSDFDQANWYAFGRLAWDPTLSPRSIADEWTVQTWREEQPVREAIVDMMLRSRKAVVDYMTPLGLAHLMASGHHYGPGPWVNDLPRADWNPTYFHRADQVGIGFDRTGSGSNAAAQYRPAVAACFADRACVPDDLLLWFHHVGWDERMRSGRSLWEELVAHYDRGVDEVVSFRRTWLGLRGKIDEKRFAAVAAKLAQQQMEARWWRDASIAYWQSVNGRPLPPNTRPPAHDLATYRALRSAHVPGDPSGR